MAKKAKKNVVSINWDEEEGGKFLKNPGEYIVQVTSAEIDEDDEGKQFITWSLEVSEGKSKGATISTRTYITPKALWKLRELLGCMGIEVQNDSIQELDLDEVIESAENFVIEVEEGNENPNGGYYMTVADFMPLEEYKKASAPSDDEDEGEVEEEKPAKKSKKAKKPEPQEEEDSEEEEAPKKKSKKSKKSKEVDEDELLDQMEEEIDELGLDIDLDDYDTFEEKQEAFEEAKEKALKKSKKSKKQEVEDEDEEEESEAQTYTVEEIESLGTKQLKVIAEEIGLELDDEASTRSKRRSVIAGLRKAGLLEE